MLTTLSNTVGKVVGYLQAVRVRSRENTERTLRETEMALSQNRKVGNSETPLVVRVITSVEEVVHSVS